MTPKGWIEGKVSDVVKALDSGVSVNGDNREKLPHEKGVLKVSAVSYGFFDRTAYKAINGEELERAKTHPKAGQVIISRSNTEKLVGASAFIYEDHDDLFLPDKLWQTVPRQNSNMKWLSYVLASEKSRYTLSNLATGTSGSMKNITKGELLSLKILIPSSVEQNKIAQILSAWDKAIETVEVLIEKTKLQKKALMQQLFTGEKRLTGFNDEAWKTVPITKMGRIVSGGTPDTTKQAYWNGNVLWTTPTDITALATRYIDNTKRKITADGLKNSSATLLPKASLLVCTRATIGYMAIAKNEITTNQGFKSMVPNSNHDVGFLYYLFSYFKHRFIRMACGSTFLEISKKDFSKLEFDVPGIKNQQAIATVLSDLDAVITIYQHQLNCLQQEKKALMQQLLTGKRRVKLDESNEQNSLLEKTG